MMAHAPDLVRWDKLASSDDQDRTADLVFTHPVNRTSKNGVTGFPSRATSQKGENLFRVMVEDLSALVRRGLVEQPPLEHSYFARVL
jgi:creatinine amidohydrolase